MIVTADPSLVEPALLLALGLAMILVPGWSRRQAQSVHDADVADRLARGRDSYFEELRALRTYPPPRSSWAWRGLGLLLASLGLLILSSRVTN